MTERYAELGREHIPKTSTTAKVIWILMTKKPEQEEGDQEDVAWLTEDTRSLRESVHRPVIKSNPTGYGSRKRYPM
jgi:hypothetical protein